MATSTVPNRWSASWTILRIALEERLVYRGDFALGTLMRFLPIVTQIFLWNTVFQAVAAPASGEQKLVAGYTYEDMVAYYLLTMLSRAFSSMPGLSSGIARLIRTGEVKKFLIQPIDLLWFHFLSRVAHKLAYYSVAIGPFALVFFLCRAYFPALPPTDTLGLFALTLILGFLLGYFLEVSLGLVGFWWLEISSLIFVYTLLSFFLSGHMFPLDMLGTKWHWAVQLLPLQYLAYFPAAVFLGKVTGSALWFGILIEMVWVVGLIALSRWLLRRGIVRYSGFGG